MGIVGEWQSDQRLWLIAAVLWAFAEATFFFIVPDILLTASLLFVGLQRAFRLATFAALAAMVGGIIMWRWGAAEPEVARAFLLSVPLLGEDLVTRVNGEMAGAWPIELTFGAISGAPYKIYAVEAGATGINPVLFSLTSFIARLLRFSLAIGLAALGFAVARRMGLQHLNPMGLAAVWAGIYAFYLYIRLTVA